MLTKAEADLTANALLAQARTQSQAVRHRPEVPQWFLDAPDGLDPAQKQRRFAELQRQSRGVPALAAVPGVMMPTLAHHIGAAWLICIVALQFLILVGGVARTRMAVRADAAPTRPEKRELVDECEPGSGPSGPLAWRVPSIAVDR